MSPCGLTGSWSVLANGSAPRLKGTPILSVLRFAALALVLMLAVSGCTGEKIDPETAVATAVAISVTMDQLATDRDKAQAKYEQVWARVERGPQMALRVNLQTADQFDDLGMTVDANRLRSEAQANFNSDPLVIQAKELLERYQWLDLEWRKNNAAVADALSDVQKAGADDMYRKRYLEALESR